MIGDDGFADRTERTPSFDTKAGAVTITSLFVMVLLLCGAAC